MSASSCLGLFLRVSWAFLSVLSGRVSLLLPLLSLPLIALTVHNRLLPPEEASQGILVLLGPLGSVGPIRMWSGYLSGWMGAWMGKSMAHS